MAVKSREMRIRQVARNGDTWTNDRNREEADVKWRFILKCVLKY
jgi:hypothetical protein